MLGLKMPIKVHFKINYISAEMCTFYASQFRTWIFLAQLCHFTTLNLQYSYTE